jgi:hypothetical protein
VTADGREYFKDHNTQTTHWRLPDIAPAPVVPRPQAATRTPGLERFDAERIRVEIESTRATLALVASSGSGPTHELEAQLAELQSRHATLIGGGAAAQPQDDYVMNPLAGALPVRGSAGLTDLLRQRSRDERQRRQQADAELARVLQRGWATEDREREARAEAERLRRREREQAGTFIWEYRPARAGQEVPRSLRSEEAQRLAALLEEKRAHLARPKADARSWPGYLDACVTGSAS